MMARTVVEMEVKKRRLRLRDRDRIFFAPLDASPVEIFLQRGGAGSYPDVPSRRIAIDTDGSIVAARNKTIGSVVTELSSSERVDINSEDNASELSIVGGSGITGASDNTDTYWVGVIFPELREFDGLFAKASITTDSLNNLTAVESSGDTTNLIDGSWTTRSANLTDPANVDPSYRSAITSFAVSNVRGVRVHVSPANSNGRFFQALHIYGEIAAGETPDRLLWVDNNTGSEFALPIDYGDIPRGSAEEDEVKLRNNSSTLSASSVQVTAEALVGASGAWYTFAEAGIGSYQSTLALASSIGASSDSPVITVRRNTPDDETLGLHAARALVNVGAWS